MKIFGHPLHVMLIHFPAALLPMDFLFSFLFYNGHNNAIGNAGFYCLLAGVISSWVAMITGFADLVKLTRTNKPSVNTALVHALVNGVVVGAFSIVAWKECKSGLIPASMGSLIFKFVLTIALFAGNYFGGKLIYTYKAGLAELTGEKS